MSIGQFEICISGCSVSPHQINPVTRLISDHFDGMGFAALRSGSYRHINGIMEQLSRSCQFVLLPSFVELYFSWIAF